MTILTAAPEDPAGYGRILRKSPKSSEVEAIVEQKALTAKQQSLREINSGIYAFKTAPLLARLDLLDANNANEELMLTRYGPVYCAPPESAWWPFRARRGGRSSGRQHHRGAGALDATLRAKPGKPADGAGA